MGSSAFPHVLRLIFGRNRNELLGRGARHLCRQGCWKWECWSAICVRPMTQNGKPRNLSFQTNKTRPSRCSISISYSIHLTGFFCAWVSPQNERLFWNQCDHSVCKRFFSSRVIWFDGFSVLLVAHTHTHTPIHTPTHTLTQRARD